MASSVDNNGASNEKKAFSYWGYLKVDELLDCQKLESERHGAIAHEEHLFIITHQAFELWFKQILFDMKSVQKMFQDKSAVEGNYLIIITRLKRIHMIFILIVEHFHILETMTPMDFLDFRGYLSPASGYQSLQFRRIENQLGVFEENRVRHNDESYKKVFTEEKHIKELTESLTEVNLLESVNSWLEYMVDEYGGSFVELYESAVGKMLDEEKADEKTRAGFEEIIENEKYNARWRTGVAGGHRLTHKAYLGGLMVQLYRHEERLQQPFEIVTWLMNIDAAVAKWRHVHVTMVQRMIGSKIGTGGSSGYHYLSATNSDKYKVFLDFVNMATYMVPRRFLGPLKSR